MRLYEECPRPGEEHVVLYQPHLGVLGVFRAPAEQCKLLVRVVERRAATLVVAVRYLRARPRAEQHTGARQRRRSSTSAVIVVEQQVEVSARSA